MRWSKGRVSVVALVLLVAVYGATAAFAKKKPPMMMADTGAKLTVLAPKTGTTLTDNALATQVSIAHFKVDCRFAGTANRMGIGHYHVELDGSLVNMVCGPGSSISMLDVAPGKHTVQFIPPENDHADDMKAMKQISFTYKPAHPLAAARPLSFAGKPSVSVVSPRPGATVQGGFSSEPAFEELRRRYRRAVERACRSIVGGELEDCAQEVFVRIWRKAALYDRGRGNAPAWLLTLARRTALNFRQRREASLPDELLDETAIEAPDVDRFWVEAALERLPERERLVIELAYLHDLSQSEIAAELRVPLGSVKSWTRRGLHHLATLLGEETQ